jgi:hypothetical protein
VSGGVSAARGAGFGGAPVRKSDFFTGPLAAARRAFEWKRWVAFWSLMLGRYLVPMSP